VLLVEDNPTDIFVIKEVLEGCGLNLRLQVARNGQEALFYLRRLGDDKAACPALVLLDLNLPKVAGMEVLRELRHISQCKRTRVVVVSSSGAEADRAAAQQLGADGYFEKPPDLSAYNQLAQVIRNVLRETEDSSGS
jgi:CheY-like chemotaxis protein